MLPQARPRRLLAGVSLAALLFGLSNTPAAAQLARLRANAGTVNPASAAAATTSAPVRPATMTEALARQTAMQTQAQQLQAYVQSARNAAYASVPGAANVTDGISVAGLNPIAAVRAVTVIAPAGTAAGSVTANAAPSSTLAGNDPTGLNTWQGASAPVQTTSTSGAVTVTITQNQQNALLSWQNFNIGANTTLNFVQQQAGVAQPGWTVVNRVVNSVNPSLILGSIHADGTVLVLNSNGIIFGPKSQVNLNALLVSTLELGNFASQVVTQGSTQLFVASTISDRNLAFLQNGLLVQGVGGYQSQLVSALLPAGDYNVTNALPTPSEGSVIVDSGASITSGAGGYIILAGPTVVNAGSLYATNGQVSLQAGENIGVVASAGGTGATDPSVRGLVLSSQIPFVPVTPQAPTPDQGLVVNLGYIQSTRGYISLGTAPYGTVENDGLLEATTSVSRNGYIRLTAGTVTLAGGATGATASGIVIVPDTDGETVPQGTPTSPPAFNASQVYIGDSIATYESGIAVNLCPSVFSMGQNAFIYAPNATVLIGADASSSSFTPQLEINSGVTIASGATIDVAGIMNVETSASINSVEISPAKQNELRDTPNYRPVTTDGSFTLNGATLYVDATTSGVRSDGVAWAGSPLLEAASAISQIPVTVSQLMTKGGTISIDVGPQNGSLNLTPSQVPSINIAKGAVFDISGGWVTYDAGYVLTSELVTASGGYVNIANANPNGNYVAVVNGFTSTQPAFGISQTYYNAAIQGEKYETAYDEGRDAGALEIVSTLIAFDGTVYGNAFAGANQLASAQAASAASSITGDPRKLQYSQYQLPSGGLFRIGSFYGNSGFGLGQDIVVYDGTRNADNSGNLIAANTAEILLDANMLTNAGLSALMLQTSGAVTFTAPSDAATILSASPVLSGSPALTLTAPANLTLAAGGVLEVDAGRSIRFDTNVRIPDGTIAAQTYQLSSVSGPGEGTVGNPFRTDDDIAVTYGSSSVLPSPFNVIVNGVLDVSGKWTNDYTVGVTPQGAAWINGGTVSLTVAPNAFVSLGSNSVADISGNITINPGALLDVSAGGYVSAKGALTLTGTGGNVSLIDATTYATLSPLAGFGGDTAFIEFGQGVAFNSLGVTGNSNGVNPSVVPAHANSTIKFAPGTIEGFGFASGGTFKLIAPDIAVTAAGVGASQDPLATVIPLDFLAQTGFGTLNLTAYHSQTYSNLFDNNSPLASAFFTTTQVIVGNGQTLDLSQSLLPTILDEKTAQALVSLPSGSNVVSVLTASIPSVAWYQKPATLSLNGLMELDVEAGGTVIGAAQATIVTPKLYNAGTIDLPGGTISEVATLPLALSSQGYGLSNPAFGGTGFAGIFGVTNAAGQYQLGANNAAGLTDTSGHVLTNNELFTVQDGSERFLYFLGQVPTTTGILLTSGSVTNLAGNIVYNPAAPINPATGLMYNVGTIINGGNIVLAAQLNYTTNNLFPAAKYGYNPYAVAMGLSTNVQVARREFLAESGSTINISGTSGILDVQNAAGQYVKTSEWSNGGSLNLLGGGGFSGANVLASGGAANATGGTLELLDPTISAADPCAGITVCSGVSNTVYADQVAKSGFSNLIADGGLTLNGTFKLALNASFQVRSPVSIDGNTVGANASVTISATPGTNVTIAAPYINFSSTSGSVNTSLGSSTGDATVTFSAGRSGIDFIGGITFDASIGHVNLASISDVRLIGVDDRSSSSQEPVLDGGILAAGNITFDAARVYTTTGTGNLQRILQDAAGTNDANPPAPYLLEAIGTSTITFLGDHINNTTPLSAGSYLQILAAAVTQDGYVAAPMGRIDFGSSATPITNITFGAGSVTSVSGLGMNVPYGTTTNLAVYFFGPSTAAALTELPSGQLSITAQNINVLNGSTINGSGGGSVFGYEFVSGTGGSRDLLSRFNTDQFSSNSYNSTSGIGYQYADARQVYAIVPLAEAQSIALYDPIYSADYSRVPTFDDNGTQGPTNLYGANAGLAVTLDGGGGIAAGQYVLMPAHYALLPGAYRIVQNSGQAAPATGTVQTLLDGSVVMGGTYSTAGTGLSSSQRVSFTVESQSTFLKYSDIQTSDATTLIKAAAASEGLSVPSNPLNAAQVVLDPLNQLNVEGQFDLTSAVGGNGSEVDILGSSIALSPNDTTKLPNTLVLSNKTIANLNANSLLIGGERIENSNDTTTLDVSASKIIVENNVNITLPELILAVGGKGSRLIINDGAVLTSTGTLDDSRMGDYVIDGTTALFGKAVPPPSEFDTTGIGSLVRISAGPQRLVDRTGTSAQNSNRASTLKIGQDQITANSFLLDTSYKLDVSKQADITVPNIAIDANDISFGANGTISASVEAGLATATTLTLASSHVISFDANTAHTFNGLIIDAPGLDLNNETGVSATLTLNTGALTLQNSNGTSLACGAKGAPTCSTSNNTLTINATSLTLGSGTFETYGFDKSVAITATKGAYFEGAGTLALRAASFGLTTPFLIDRAAVVDPNSPSPTPSDAITPAGNYTIPVTPDYVIGTTGAVTLTAPVLASGSTVPTPVGLRAPGAQIDFGSASAPVGSLSIDGVAVTATAGVINAISTASISMSNGASLATPGFSRSYGDAQDVATVSAGGGTVNLVSLTGNISAPTGTAFIVDTGTGNAGTLNLIAAEGAVALGATLNAGVTGPRAASLTLDSQTAAFDLSSFASQYGQLFEGALSIRSGVGNLGLAAGETLKSTGVTLTADGGVIDIAGTIDTSGVNIAGLSTNAAANAIVNGGNIALWGMAGVTLESGSLLDTHTSGYADTDLRQASAGNITIGVGNSSAATISIASGATLNLGATRTEAAIAAGETGNRLVPQTVANPATLVNTTVYDFVAADAGGTLLLRAPVLSAPTGSAAAWGVNISIGAKANIVGASAQQIEGYQTYNLDMIAAKGQYDGVTTSSLGITLDATSTGNNILSDYFIGSDGTVSVPYFVQNFSLTAEDGITNLAGFVKKPGVNLVSSTNVTLVTNWNLAAGTLNTAAALAAGDLTPLSELGTRADGSSYYGVVSGTESDLLANYVKFLYRVGGTAAGQAGVFTFDAGGNLTIDGSISDGFFTFADKSDGAWINYQLGGGQRTYNPGVLGSCGFTNNCRNIVSYSPAAANAGSPSFYIDLSTYYGAEQGASSVIAPYDPVANSAIAAGSNIDPSTNQVTGNPLGFAELFPLLPSGGAIQSSSLRLVGGASNIVDHSSGATVFSADPLHINPISAGNVTVEGGNQYSLNATAVPVTLTDDLKILLGTAGLAPANDPAFEIQNLIGNTVTTDGASALNANTLTTLNWGDARFNLPQLFTQDAKSFFTKSSIGTLLPSSNGFSGVSAPLSQIVNFLELFKNDYLSQLGTRGAGAPVESIITPTLVTYSNPIAFTVNMVRTGNGDIDVAAGGNVDLTNEAYNLINYGEAVVYRNAFGQYETPAGRHYTSVSPGVSQSGGTAIYTAGVRLSEVPIEANVVGTGAAVMFTPGGNFQAIPLQSATFQPSPKGYDDQNPVNASGGGNVTITAVGNVLALSDDWSQSFVGSGDTYNKVSSSNVNTTTIGDNTQLWRVGGVSQDTEMAIAPKYFTSGVGALAGGDVTIRAGSNVAELTVALDSTVTTTTTSAGPVLATLGHGSLNETIIGNLITGQIDVANGSGAVNVAGNVESASSGQALEVRIADATFNLTASGSISMSGVSALAAKQLGDTANSYNAAGYFASTSSFTATATGFLNYADSRGDQSVAFQLAGGSTSSEGGSVLPPNLSLSALTSSLITSGTALVLYPSATGELALFSAGNISGLVIAMSDSNPSLLPGAFSAAQLEISGGSSGSVVPIQGLGFGIPGVTPTTSEGLLRIYHDQSILHQGDNNPIRIFAGVDITNSLINLPKEAEIIAGRDISDLYFTGQNINTSDTTVIQAGRDIVGTTGTSPLFNLPYVLSNDFVLGGPGNFQVQAGRNLGPFINSAVVGNTSYPGGIQTVGNLYDPWLTTTGANLTVLFGVANGINYAGFEQTYLDPANFGQLDGSLFVQTTDANGNKHPVRTEQIYAPILAEWLRTNDPIAFAAIYGLGTFTDASSATTAIAASSYANTTAGNAALTTASYAQSQSMYNAFTKINALEQDQFLINDVYFNELQQPAEPTSPSYLQYFRGYWAIDALFSPSLGYTNNLAAYTVNASTVSADHPLGVPSRNLINGQPQKAPQVQTGNANLELATIQTASGGNLTILGPGGNFIAGSVVRTSTQAASIVTRFGVPLPNQIVYGSIDDTSTNRISSIPIGYEGVLTLNGGNVSAFTDGNFLVNQSRVFSEAGGDITMWSSNGDLNAGEGPKTASNFPPVTVATDLDGYSTVDSAGSVSGAGIGAFQRLPTDPKSSIILVAPAGLVDAGDAGVRASGNILVAAAHVANADSFSAGGSISGVPSRAAAPAATPTNSSSSVAAAAGATSASNDNAQTKSIITVNVEGYVGNASPCDDPNVNDPDCRKKQAN